MLSPAIPVACIRPANHAIPCFSSSLIVPVLIAWNYFRGIFAIVFIETNHLFNIFIWGLSPDSGTMPP